VNNQLAQFKSGKGAHHNSGDMMFSGTQVNYYFICKRKLWLFSHNIVIESESDLVKLGKLIHERGYKRKLKEVQVDRIKVDFLDHQRMIAKRVYATRMQNERQGNAEQSIVIHEVKRSRSMQDAHVFQLLYYIYYLRKNYNAHVNLGILHYPLLKENIPIELTEEKARQLEDVLNDIAELVSKPVPQAVWLKPCSSCAYIEVCWS